MKLNEMLVCIDLCTWIEWLWIIKKFG